MVDNNNVTYTVDNWTNDAVNIFNGTPFVTVEITGTNSPVPEGETIEVYADVSKTGGLPDTHEVILSEDGNNVDSINIKLSSGETKSITLKWNTSSNDGGLSKVCASVSQSQDCTIVTVTDVITVSGETFAGYETGIYGEVKLKDSSFPTSFSPDYRDYGKMYGRIRVNSIHGSTEYDKHEWTLDSWSISPTPDVQHNVELDKDTGRYCEVLLTVQAEDYTGDLSITVTVEDTAQGRGESDTNTTTISIVE